MKCGVSWRDGGDSVLGWGSNRERVCSQEVTASQRGVLKERILIARHGLGPLFDPPRRQKRRAATKPNTHPMSYIPLQMRKIPPDSVGIDRVTE